MIDSIELSYAPESDWPANQHDFNEDASTLLDQAEEKRKAEIMHLRKATALSQLTKVTMHLRFSTRFTTRKRENLTIVT